MSDMGVVEGAAGGRDGSVRDRLEDLAVRINSHGDSDLLMEAAALVADREAREAEHFEFRRNSAKHFLAQQDRFNADREALLERIKELELLGGSAAACSGGDS